MKIINFIRSLILVLLLGGIFSCNNPILNTPLPDLIEVPIINDNMEDIILSESSGEIQILNTKTEKVSFIDIDRYLPNSYVVGIKSAGKVEHDVLSLLPFESGKGALIYLNGYPDNRVYRYYPKEGKLKKIDTGIHTANCCVYWSNVNDDEIWISESKVYIYSISQNKMIGSRNIPNKVMRREGDNNKLKIGGKTYIQHYYYYDEPEGVSNVYCIEDSKLIKIFEEGDITPLSENIIMHHEHDFLYSYYKVKSIEPLDIEEIFRYKDNYYTKSYEVNNKYFLVESYSNIIASIDITSYQKEKYIEFPFKINTTHYKDRYIWVFGEKENREICRFDPNTLEIKIIKY